MPALLTACARCQLRWSRPPASFSQQVLITTLQGPVSVMLMQFSCYVQCVLSGVSRTFSLCIMRPRRHLVWYKSHQTQTFL